MTEYEFQIEKKTHYKEYTVSQNIIHNVKILDQTVFLSQNIIIKVNSHNKTNAGVSNNMSNTE